MKYKILLLLCLGGSLWAADLSLSSDPILQLGIHKDGTDRFKRVGSVAISDQGHIYVLDSGESRISKFDAKGNLLEQMGGVGIDPGEFFGPSELVCVGAYLWVADYGNSRIQVFKDLAHIKTISFPELEKPKNMAVLDGTVYVTGGSLHQKYTKVTTFGPSGKLRRDRVIISEPLRPESSQAAQLNKFQLFALGKDKLVMGFFHTDKVLVANKSCELITSQNMAGIYGLSEQKSPTEDLRSGYVARAFSQGPDQTMLVAVCDQEKRNCNTVYLLDVGLQNVLQRWSFAKSVRFLKYEPDLGLLVVAQKTKVEIYTLD